MFSPTKQLSASLLALAALLVSACADNDRASPSPQPVSPAPPPADEPAEQAIPDGVWIQRGFGRVLEITGESVAQYDFTRETCMSVRTITQNELTEIITVQTVGSDELVATEDEGTLVFSRRDDLPSACEDNRLITENGPVATLNHIIHNFDDYYPFFELRGILDWDERVRTARGQVNEQSTDEELLDTIIALLSGLNDGHVTLSAGDEFEFTPASQDGKILDILATGFAAQSEITDFDAYSTEQLSRILAIRDSYFDAESFDSAGGENQDVFQWATIGNGLVGYLEVNSMGGISLNDAQSDAAAAEDIMDRALTDLQHTEALIINVLSNGGGELSVADAVASRFTTDTVTVSAYETITFDGSSTPQRTPLIERDLAPTEHVSYRGPVATISGPNTFSAAEHFLLSMRALNHPVCFIGERSDGILSAILNKPLPTEGTMLGLSNMIIYDHTGQAFEAVGVPVDIGATTFELVDSSSDTIEAIDASMVALGFGYLVDRDGQAAECSFMEARTRLEFSAP